MFKVITYPSLKTLDVNPTLLIIISESINYQDALIMNFDENYYYNCFHFD